MPLDLAVIHSPVGGGHKAAAFAVAEVARARGMSVEVLDTFEHAPSPLGGAYLGAHLAAQGVVPQLYDSAYFAANHRDGTFEPVRRAIDHVAWAGLVRRVVELSPRLVVGTHHLPLLVLGRARRKGRLAAPLVGVVTDYGAHACWAEKGVDAMCVPSPRAFRDLVRHRFPVERIRYTGIPVRPAFEAIADVREPEPAEPLRVLVTSGGFGVGPIGAIVRSFAGMQGVELTVVCGRAEGLVRRVRRAAGHAGAGVSARVLGFERDMPARIAEAHVVVGKAGGLTVSETLTAGRPMVVAGAAPGNEGINAAMLVEAGAGVLVEPQSVGTVVAQMRASHAISLMGRCARALVITRAADRVIDVGLQLAATTAHAA